MNPSYQNGRRPPAPNGISPGQPGDGQGHHPPAPGGPPPAVPGAGGGESPGAARAVGCDLLAHAWVQVPVESLAELRRQPGPVPGRPLPCSFLKHADEQTVAGLTAVFRAAQEGGLAGADFTDWGVVAASRFLGRPAMAAALQRFAAEGAWGVSPHLIPHRSLHSVSGTVSQALKIQGPNFGVGGGPTGTTEVLLTATALLERNRLPGVWVVLTALHPERAPDAAGRPAPGTDAVGLALALVRARPDRPGVRLRVVAGCHAAAPRADRPQAGFDLFRLQKLLGVVARGTGRGDTTLIQLLEAGSRLELSRAAPAPDKTTTSVLCRAPHPSSSLTADC